jgi:parallel beta-helix repeat protein
MKHVFIIALVTVVMIGVMVPSVFAYTITDDATGGDCSIFGMWDSTSKTCTLTRDLTEGITIQSSYVTLDGNGNSIIGTNPSDNWNTPNTTFGVFVDSRTNIILKNLEISNFYHGIYLSSIVNTQIENNVIFDNLSAQIKLDSSNNNKILNNVIPCGVGIVGIATYFGDGNSILGNTISDCELKGIEAGQEKNFIVSDNLVDMQNSGNFQPMGMDIGSDSASLIGNTVQNSHYGIRYSGMDSIIKNNIISNHSVIGLSSDRGGKTIITENNMSDNEMGISLRGGESVYHNNFISNNVDGSGITMNTGGNYWENFSLNCSDNNNDNFCDESHPLSSIHNIQDNFWIVQDGWKTIIDTPSNSTVNAVDSSGLSHNYSVSATHDGDFMGVSCDYVSGSTFPIGVTDVLCTANNGIHSTFSVTVNSPSSTISSISLGIASFVDQTKDPQHYIDRFNTEPTYKEWFDENYSQYSSIYEAVGLEEPVTKSIPEPVVEPVVEYASERNSPGAITTSEYDDIRNQMGLESCETKECAEAQSWAMLEHAKETGQYADPFASQLPKESAGGCLIATATYGSELSPQVQQLRELRDNQLLQTESGTAFMGAFNDFYYSFSPVIADYERENPLFKEAVKLAITPMLSSLSLMENANSESEVLGIGLSVIMLNLGMYLGIPAVVIMKIRKMNL